jgi:hypothetical protein
MHQHVDPESVQEERAREAQASRANLVLSFQVAVRDAQVAARDGRSEISYELARLCNRLDNAGVNPQSLADGLDIVDFVFRNTHYDECSNWHFFRRS